MSRLLLYNAHGTLDTQNLQALRHLVLLLLLHHLS